MHRLEKKLLADIFGDLPETMLDNVFFFFLEMRSLSSVKVITVLCLYDIECLCPYNYDQMNWQLSYP